MALFGRRSSSRMVGNSSSRRDHHDERWGALGSAKPACRRRARSAAPHHRPYDRPDRPSSRRSAQMRGITKVKTLPGHTPAQAATQRAAPNTCHVGSGLDHDRTGGHTVDARARLPRGLIYPHDSRKSPRNTCAQVPVIYPLAGCQSRKFASLNTTPTSKRLIDSVKLML